MERQYVQRTVKVPLVSLDKETWLRLRQLAFECSRYGNHLLTEQYAKAKGLEGLTPYTDYRDKLSSRIRDAVGRECVGIWRRLGKKILRGEQTLARFSADRALVVRDRGISIQRQGDQITIALSLEPNRAPATLFPVYMSALKRDKYLRDLLDKLTAGEHRLSKAAIQFERPGMKVFIRLSYEKEIQLDERGKREALLEANVYGQLWLRSEGQRRSLTHHVETLKKKRLEFGKITRRIGRHLKGRTRRQALLRRTDFATWSVGKVHNLTAEIVKQCAAWNCGKLLATLPVPENTEIAWHEIISQLKYKCEERAIHFEAERIVPVQETEGLEAKIKAVHAELGAEMERFVV